MNSMLSFLYWYCYANKYSITDDWHLNSLFKSPFIIFIRRLIRIPIIVIIRSNVVRHNDNPQDFVHLLPIFMLSLLIFLIRLLMFPTDLVALIFLNVAP